MKLYFKKYITVCKSSNKIHIYHLSDKKQTISIDFNEVNYNIIEHIIKSGIEDSDINKTPIHRKLFDNGFLYKNSSFQDKDSINRTELFLNFLYEDLTTEDIDKIRTTKILVYGAGGGGSSLIYQLAQFGFKNLSIVDFDVVEQSDVHRTMTFSSNDIGKTKISVLKERIKTNFSIDLNVYEGSYSQKNEIDEMIEIVKPDFVINACDPRPSFKLDLNVLCFKYRIPYILLAYSYDTIYVGPIYVPTITSCENSFDEYVKKTFGEDHSFRLIEKLFTNELAHPSNIFNINIIASMAFKEVLFFLMGKYDYCQTIGQRVFFNPLTYNLYTRKAKCKTNCKVCN